MGYLQIFPAFRDKTFRAIPVNQPPDSERMPRLPVGFREDGRENTLQPARQLFSRPACHYNLALKGKPRKVQAGFGLLSK